jgi:glycosyltransferase involved in cell wall biosynthesis
MIAPTPLTVIQLLPALNGGGVERGTLEIGNYLVQQGHRSIVISAGERMVEQLIKEGSEHIQADIGAKKLSTLRYIFWLRQLLLEIRPDILHFRSRLPAWVGYLAWKSLPKTSRPRLVTTFHGQHSVNRYSAIMTCGERIITVSEMMKDYILRSYPAVDAAKIQVIHRGVDTGVYYPGYRPDTDWLKQWFEQFPQTRDISLLTLPGRLTRRKGIEDFIEIIANLRQSGVAVHGLIVGETHPKQTHYQQELADLITTHRLENSITFTGHRSDLQNILAISSVVLSLSKIPESFGRTATEALSMGIPVVGYAHGGIEEQLNALFPEGNVVVGDVAMASFKIKEFLSFQPEVQANHCFTLDNMCSKTLGVYQDIMQSSRNEEI